MTDQITVPRATWDALWEANVQWIEAYAKLRMERDSLKKEAELGNIAMLFVDRAGDVADCDPAERICSEFHEAMSDAVDRLYVQPRSALTAANAVVADKPVPELENVKRAALILLNELQIVQGKLAAMEAKYKK